MNNTTIFGIKDNFADSKAKYKDLQMFETSTDIYKIPQKYLDTYKPRYNTYYFTNEQKAEMFMAELEHKYIKRKQNTYNKDININEQRELKQEFLEKGLIIGSIATILEKDKQIDFTCNMAYDTDFLELANNLITEFNNSNEKYFIEFVEYRLKEMQKEINEKEKSNENN